jgi:hypothetical protein
MCLLWSTNWDSITQKKAFFNTKKNLLCYDCISSLDPACKVNHGCEICCSSARDPPTSVRQQAETQDWRLVAAIKTNPFDSCLQPKAGRCTLYNQTCYETSSTTDLENTCGVCALTVRSVILICSGYLTTIFTGLLQCHSRIYVNYIQTFIFFSYTS